MSFLSYKGTLLSHDLAVVHQDNQTLLYRAPFQQISSVAVLVCWYSSTGVGLYTSCWMKWYSSLLNYWACPGLIEWQHSLLLCQPLLPASVSTSNLLKVYSIPPSRSLLKMLNKIKSRTDPWATLLVIGLQLDSATLIIHLRSTSQPVPSPPHCPLVYPILSKFIWEYVTWDDVKNLYEIKVQNTRCSPPIYPSGHNIMEGCHVHQAWFPLVGYK